MEDDERAGAESEIDRLYGLPLDEFVAARDDAAKRLRAGGERAAAAEVAAARKPTVAAWAVNQLTRGQAAKVRALLGAGERLRAAADRGALEEAHRDERAAVERLVQCARELLEGPAPGTLDRVRDTLHAASADDEARDLLRSGRLTKERRAIGFGPGAPVPGSGPRPRRSRARAKSAEPPAARRRRQEAAKRLRAAEREVERTRRRVEEARADLDAAEAALARAEAAHAKARRAVDRA